MYKKYEPSLKDAMSDEQEAALILSGIEAIAAKSGVVIGRTKSTASIMADGHSACASTASPG